MRPMKPAIAVLLALGLCNCVGAGMLAKTGAKEIFGGDKGAAERIAKAQEKAISAAQGGSAGAPIAWSDSASGIQGSFVLQSDGDAPQGCHRYQQTIVLAGETLQGVTTACQQKDGSWKLSGRAAS